MKTLSQLKRDIERGTNILTITNECKPDTQNTMRTVSYVDTTGFYLKDLRDETNKKGSFCGFPKAKHLKYTNDTFKIDDGHGVRTYQIIN